MRYSSFYKVFLEKRNFYYTIPVSKEKLLYDFYTIEMLNHYVKKRFNPNRPDSPPTGFDEDDPERVSVKEAREILVPFLKKEMLDAMFVSCSCEIRHVIDFLGPDYHPVGKTEESVLDKLTPQNKKVFLYYKKYYNNLIEKFNHYENTKVKNDFFSIQSPGKRHSPRNVTVVGHESDDRIHSVKAANKTAKEYGKPAVVRMFHEMFQLDVWTTDFGGKPWANIAECYLDLNSVPKSDLNQMTVYIDRAYDLQHNTGSVFNKIKEYLGDVNKDYEWITKALDFKYSANPWNLAAKSSGILPRLSKIILAKARVEKPIENVLELSGYSHFDIMSDADFIHYLKTSRSIRDVWEFSNSYVKPASFYKNGYEKINKLSKEFVEALTKRVVNLRSEDYAAYLVDKLVSEFPFKFYTPLAQSFLGDSAVTISSTFQIRNAKDLINTFYKEPAWRTENPEFLKVLEKHVADDVNKFFSTEAYKLDFYGDMRAVNDAKEFLTNLKTAGKLTTSFADDVINSYNSYDAYEKLI